MNERLSKPVNAEIDGSFVFHLGDALSTVRDVVDDTGAVIKSFDFDEYGNLLSSSGSGTTSPKTFVGGLSVNDDTADSGMFNMGHWNYAGGVLGRFISRDPIGHQGGLNLYAYPSRPVDRVDPMGLLEEEGGEFVSYIVDSGVLKDEALGRSYEADVGHLRTNKGTFILAWKNKSKNSKADTDCHGLTFTRGEFWLNDIEQSNLDFSQVQAILDDEYLKLPSGKLPMPGDVAIFRNHEGSIVHSATVMSGGKNPWLYEISGQHSKPLCQPLGTSSNFTPTFYYRPSSFLR